LSLAISPPRASEMEHRLDVFFFSSRGHISPPHRGSRTKAKKSSLLCRNGLVLIPTVNGAGAPRAHSVLRPLRLQDTRLRACKTRVFSACAAQRVKNEESMVGKAEFTF